MNAQLSERQELAVEVLRLAKDRLLVSSPFLAPAASLLPFVPSPDALSPLSGTDAKAFYFNADHVLACFAATHEAPVHDYVHTLLHCLFLHPFANPGQNQARWDLACDIAAECIAVELCGPRPGGYGQQHGVCSRAHLRRLAAGPADCGIDVRAAENRPFR